MKYSVEKILKGGAAMLISDDGERLTAGREKFDREPAEGMVFELDGEIFRCDERAQSERKKEAAALLDGLLNRGRE